MRLAVNEIADHINVVVDQDAEPANWDAAVATFLLAYIRSRTPIGTVGTAATEPIVLPYTPQQESRSP